MAEPVGVAARAHASGPADAAELAHALRAPLHAVGGLTQLLAETALPGPARQLADTLAAEVRVLLERYEATLAAEHRDVVPPAGVSSEQTDPAPAHLHLLVVEDSPVNRMLVAAQLDRLGHRATVVGSGEEALELLPGLAVDAVMMDWQLPGMDGLETTRRIRLLENDGMLAGRRVVVGLTANAMAGDRRRCLEAGMDDVLVKPVGLVDLARVLATVPPTTAGAPSRHTVPAVDAAVLEGLVDDVGDPTVVLAVVDAFLAEVPQRRAAVHGADPVGVGRTAHTLRSSAAMLGARRLEGACRRLDEACRTRGGTALDAYVSEVDAELRVAADALRDWRARTGADTSAQRIR